MSTSQRQPHGRQTSTASDDWAPATIVSNFDDDTQQQQPASDPSSLPDWDQWQEFTSSASAGPSNSHNPRTSGSGLTPSTNQADDDFFAALERSTPGETPAAATAAAAAAAGGGEGLLMPTMATPPIPHPRPPSPPEIDLEQRRIEERDRQLRASGIVGGGGSTSGSATTGAGGSDDDWFAKFERDLKSGRGRSGSQPRPELGSDQLESMREAHASPLPTPLRAKQAGNGHASGDDYFSRATTAGATRLPPPPSSKQPLQSQPPPGNNSWWGSIRHLGSDWAHRAADYLDPGVDFSDEELKLARKMGAIDLDSRSATPVGGAGAAGGKGTPSRGGSRSSSVAPAPAPARGSEQQRKGSSSSTSSHAPAPPPAKLVSGAPGVDFSSLNPRWNAGNWTLPSDDPSSSSSSRSRMASAERLATASPASSSAARKLKPLPVTLTGRRGDSSPVVTDGHAAHIQPHLPPRLKLGRTWRLCYSSDQHGISLETLYSRVGRCMDAKLGANGDGEDGRNGSSSSNAANRQDGWLRGASSATRAALGGDDFSSSSSRASSSSAAPPRLGSGLTSMRDAGLILAVRDEQDNVFGAFLNERLTRAHRGYYGNGECFLFRQVRPKGGGEEEGEVRVYGATARNNFYALGETGYLAFGGSSAQYQAERAAKAKGITRHTESRSTSTASSGYGLWLDSDFSHGVTARCETFENVPLAQSGEEPDRAAQRRVEAAERGGGGGGGQEGDERWEKEIKFEPVIVEVWAVGLD